MGDFVVVASLFADRHIGQTLNHAVTEQLVEKKLHTVLRRRSVILRAQAVHELLQLRRGCEFRLALRNDVEMPHEHIADQSRLTVFR